MIAHDHICLCDLWVLYYLYIFIKVSIHNFIQFLFSSKLKVYAAESTSYVALVAI